MCEFCHRHGEGRKWYLSVANYSEELFREAARSAAGGVLGAQPAPQAGSSVARRVAGRLVPGIVRWIERRHQQDVHWGQVVPIEDALQIVDMLDWVVRLPCVCRSLTIGDRNARYCFGVGVAPLEEPIRSFFREMIDPSSSLETLTREQARDALVELDRQGAMHSVWTFKTPFIGGLCNCDRDCGAYRAQVLGKHVCMFRSEYVAQIDPELCGGCRKCMRQCLFGAINYSLAQGRCAVNELACYGCGVCRAACEREAVSLLPRASVPAVANLWEL